MATYDEKVDSILEKIYAIAVANNSLITSRDKNTFISVLNSGLSSDFNELKTLADLKSVDPTIEAIRTIFFNNLNTNQLADDDFDLASEDIRVICRIWEDNRGDYTL